MPIIHAENLHKSYGTRALLSGVTLTIRSGERVGVVGKNGAGKSTLARVLAGVEAPDQGQLARRRGANIVYLEQVPRFEGDPSAEQVVRAGLAAWNEAVSQHEKISRRLEDRSGDASVLLESQARVAEEVERLGGWNLGHQITAVLGHVGIREVERKVTSMSGGEQRRVALARALIERADLTILDEPTNHLDAETIEWLERYLIDEHSGAVLMITHDRYLLDRVAQRTLEVADGAVHSYDGGYELYLEQKAERLAHAARTEQNRQNFLRKELEWLRRQPKARTTKQKARVERAQAALGAGGPKAEREVELALTQVRSGKTILEVEGLVLERGGQRLISSLDLYLTQGERIGVVGRNGSGKTSFLWALLGKLEASAGEVRLGKNTKVAYFDQLRSDLDDSATLYENVIGERTRIELGEQSLEPRSYLERFGFDGHAQRRSVAALSGGERARVGLAKLLSHSANLVVMDEPTNDLDIDMLGAVEAMLTEFGVTALIVTHDRWFLDRVATSILAFEADARVTLYPGNFSSYAERRDAQRVSQAAPAPRDTKRAKPGQKKSINYGEQRELDALPDAIEAVEARVDELNQRLANPETYARGGEEVQRLTHELEAARKEAARLMERWEELELKAQS